MFMITTEFQAVPIGGKKLKVAGSRLLLNFLAVPYGLILQAPIVLIFRGRSSCSGIWYHGSSTFCHAVLQEVEDLTVFYGLWFEYVNTVERHAEYPRPNQNPTERRYLGQWITSRIPNENKVLIQVHSFFLSHHHHHDRDAFAPCGPVALGGHITVMDMSAFRFSCTAARTHHTSTNHARTAQGPRAAAACAGSSRGSHRASDVEGPAPAAPESIESASSPVPLTHLSSPPCPSCSPHRRPHPLHTSTTFPRAPTRPPQRFHRRVARREAAHAVREVVLEPVIRSMTLISGRPFIKPVYTLVGLEGTGFVLVVSSSTGAAWGTLFRSSEKLRAD
ncbi:hypothetical protein JB92DRAFT_3102768 [Gautieria morchelliformis]|nr:hypothetical protein JB92DRAFT_3102768 [Gautieria morchelliformis]